MSTSETAATRAAADVTATSSDGSGGPAKSPIRLEIEGLRFIAVFLVVIYHVWLGRVSGGVDIFLLISAFLMTGQFDRKISRGDSINLGKHWLRLAKRLLPIAVVVIAATVLLAWWLVPADRWQSIITEAWSSLFYFENWTLANNAVNYYGDHSSASPFQQFWSQSVQGQVFLTWPLIFAAIALLRRKFSFNHRTVMLVVFGMIFVGSLAFSIWQTNENQVYAYFNLLTRLWEFALGSLLALAMPYLKLPRWLRITLGWVGLVLIISCGLVLQVEQQFPGFLALWPTLAAGMVIVAADTRNDIHPSTPARWQWLPGRGSGVDRILAARPLVFMGGNSYGLYLWHWPLLVFFLVASGTEHVGLLAGLGLIVAGLVLSIVSTRYIERPARTISWVESRWYRAVPVVGLAVVVAAVPVITWQSHIQGQIEQAADSPAADNPGAQVLTAGYQYSGVDAPALKPAPADLPNQFATLGKPCTGDWAASDPAVQKYCTVYTPDKPVSKTLAVVGSSHSEQWLPALQYVADQNGWQIISLYKGGCPYSFSTPGLQTDCNIYNGKVGDYLNQKHPDAVFMVGTDNKPSSNAEELGAGFEQTVQGFTDQGMQVLAMRDNPRFSFNMAECVLAKGAENSECNPSRESLMGGTNPFDTVTDPPPGLHFLDMSDYICDGGTCPGTIGNMFVYMDDNHVTRDYSATMGPALKDQIVQVTGWTGTSEQAAPAA